MIGNIIGAVAGNQAAKHIQGVDGTGGAVLGVVATTVLRRLGPAGLLAAAVGGYALKRYSERRKAKQPAYADSESIPDTIAPTA
ncbi:hypothetical protein V474_14110 [Novosphingobium barchaimii LL02]|uniref:Uncharacterized protein n=1 Tax=Novosphingobium barchaimii LL02 TaxID=1114963 RepID=A0A0J7XWN0_9SPHN|nr:hypothetical protein [Novosphingobium barchaimii]KMS56116.1 hypothetical protein V474_14110 [Novosphingobium barchaimii LL02]